MRGAGDHEKTSIPVWKEQLSWSERDSDRVRLKAEKAGSFDASQTFTSHPHFLRLQCAIGARTTPPTCSHCPMPSAQLHSFWEGDPRATPSGLCSPLPIQTEQSLSQLCPGNFQGATHIHLQPEVHLSCHSFSPTRPQISFHLTSHHPSQSPLPPLTSESHLLMDPNATLRTSKPNLPSWFNSLNPPGTAKPSLAAPPHQPRGPLSPQHWQARHPLLTTSPTPILFSPCRFPEHLLTSAATHPRLFFPKLAPHPPPPSSALSVFGEPPSLPSRV